MSSFHINVCVCACYVCEYRPAAATNYPKIYVNYYKKKKIGRLRFASIYLH